MTDPLSTDQQQQQAMVLDALRDKIKVAGGAISFAEFMQFALYEPSLGYYVSGNHKLGAGGDFTTAPLISPLFSACLGNHCAKYLPEGGEILELGAGTGAMAAGILQRLDELNQLPAHYSILEVSPELQQRQQQALKDQLPESVFAKLQWIDALPEQPTYHLILANEVMDAFAVERVRLQDQQWQQQVIRFDDDKLSEDYRPITNKHLQQAIAQLPDHLSDGYITEVNTWIEPWIKSLGQCLKDGVITLIDYGFLREEYYHPQRHMGTLKCFFQQQAYNDPLQHVGLQDITAHVDFTTVGESAEKNGLQVVDYCNQTQFLIDNGLTELLSAVTDRDEYEKLIPGVKQLTSPQEMGELFKVMVLGI